MTVCRTMCRAKPLKIKWKDYCFRAKIYQVLNLMDTAWHSRESKHVFYSILGMPVL